MISSKTADPNAMQPSSNACLGCAIQRTQQFGFATASDMPKSLKDQIRDSSRDVSKIRSISEEVT